MPKENAKAIIVTEEGQQEANPMWKSRNKGMIPLSSMDDSYLQTAYTYAQQREYHFTKKALTFASLIEAIEKEADKRKIEVKPLEFKKA